MKIINYHQGKTVFGKILKSFVLFFIFFLTAGVLSCQESVSVVITNFINETGYSGNWDIEQELPKLIIEVFADDYKETLTLRNRSWRDDGNDLGKKFPGSIIITGTIKEFTYFTSSQTPIWPFMNNTRRARVEIALDIIKDGEVYTESCAGEKIENNLGLDFFMSKQEEDNEDFDNMKFGSVEFWKSFPGNAVKKVVQECVHSIKTWVPAAR